MHAPPIRKRRESSADSGIKSMRSRRDSHNSDITKTVVKKETPGEKENQENITAILVEQQPPINRNGSRRGSGDSSSKTTVRRDSLIVPPPKVVAAHSKKRRDSLAAPETPNFRQEQRPSTSSGDSGSMYASQQVDFCHMPMMMITSVSPPATSPKFEVSKSGRRDSMTQCRITRRESRLQRQATAFDEYNTPHTSRRGSQSQQQPSLSPSGDVDCSTNLCDRQARRDSLSPDVNTSK